MLGAYLHVHVLYMQVWAPIMSYRARRQDKPFLSIAHLSDMNHISLGSILDCTNFLKVVVITMQATVTSWPSHANNIQSCARLCREAFATFASLPTTREEEVWIEEQQARFSIWTASLGVLASGPASVEYRLRENQSAYQLILQLLHSLYANLEYCKKRLMCYAS